MMGRRRTNSISRKKTNDVNHNSKRQKKEEKKLRRVLALSILSEQKSLVKAKASGRHKKLCCAEKGRSGRNYKFCSSQNRRW